MPEKIVIHPKWCRWEHAPGKTGCTDYAVFGYKECKQCKWNKKKKQYKNPAKSE